MRASNKQRALSIDGEEHHQQEHTTKMETFANRVHRESGPTRFDPIVGETGGWIHKQITPGDVEMEEAHPEVVTSIKELPSQGKVSPLIQW